MAMQKESPEEQLYRYDSFERGKKNFNFLWWCAGAQQDLLKQFPSEHIKYAGLGGVLLATFVLAGLSSGYAIHTIFGQWGWTVVFALLWACIIFNFDRFLVSTMRKYGVSAGRQWLTALPRMALALLIGLTIARPLELKVFEKEIAVKMEENLHRKIGRNDSLLMAESRYQLDNAQQERQRLAGRRAALEDTLYRLQQAYVQEADGTGGSGRRGIDHLTKLKMEAWQGSAAQYGPELTELATAIRRQDSLLSGANNGLEEKRKRYEQTLRANLGFLERNKALSDMSKEESSVWWTSLLLSALIILVEIGPVLSKILMPVGPYDIALAREELLRMAEEESSIHKGQELTLNKKKLFYQKQKAMTDELVEKLTELQRRHIDEELLKWERGEWDPRDQKPSMDAFMRKVREKYKVDEESLM